MQIARAILIEPIKNEQHRESIEAVHEYGDLWTVFQGKRPAIWTPLFCDALAVRLKSIKYDPEVDMIVMTGATNVLIAATAAIASRFGRFRALMYNSKPGHKDYENVMMGDTNVT